MFKFANPIKKYEIHKDTPYLLKYMNRINQN